MAERFLERIGILKHRMTIEEIDAFNIRLRQLTRDFLTHRIELQEYRKETDILPGIDLRSLAHNLNYQSKRS